MKKILLLSLPSLLTILLIGIGIFMSSESPVQSSNQSPHPIDQTPDSSEPIPNQNPEQNPNQNPNQNSEQAPDQTILEQLPTGLYYYSQPNPKRPNFVLFRKSGSTIIGLDHRSATAPACFRGFIDGNQIINTTRVFAPYQPDSQLQQGQTIDLTAYSVTEDTVPEDASTTLKTCISFFWR